MNYLSLLLFKKRKTSEFIIKAWLQLRTMPTREYYSHEKKIVIPYVDPSGIIPFQFSIS